MHIVFLIISQIVSQITDFKLTRPLDNYYFSKIPKKFLFLPDTMCPVFLRFKGNFRCGISKVPYK